MAVHFPVIDSWGTHLIAISGVTGLIIEALLVLFFIVQWVEQS